MAAPLNDCILCICNYDLKELYITIFLYLLMILVYLYMYYLKYIVLYINIYLWALNPSPKKETGHQHELLKFRKVSSRVGAFSKLSSSMHETSPLFGYQMERRRHAHFARISRCCENVQAKIILVY